MKKISSHSLSDYSTTGSTK